MNRTKPFDYFKQDDRIRNLDPARIEFLTELATELSDAPQNQKMAAFMSVMQKARHKNITFTAPEQDLLFSILTEHMNTEEKKKAMLIRNLASQLQNRKQ